MSFTGRRLVGREEELGAIVRLLVCGSPIRFHLFEAASIEVVEEVSRRAELGHARVVSAVEAPRPPGS